MRQQPKLKISVSLTEEQAEALGLLHKRMSHRDYRDLSANAHEMELMKQASFEVIDAIRRKGFGIT